MGYDSSFLTTTVDGISRVQTVGTVPVVGVDIPLSPGGNMRVEIDVASVQPGGTAGLNFDAKVDVYTPLSGAPTVTLTGGTTTSTGAGSGWSGGSAAAVLVGTVYHLQLSLVGAASTTVNWCVTWRITQV